MQRLIFSYNEGVVVGGIVDIDVPSTLNNLMKRNLRLLNRTMWGGVDSDHRNQRVHIHVNVIPLDSPWLTRNSQI
jgi:hypothetical protein